MKKAGSVVFFLLCLHFIYNYIGVYKYIYERPCSIHASAQCQRASVAQNYYNVSMNFFEPRIQRYNQQDAVTGLEFPVIYYTGAILYKLFGFHDYYLRIISLVIISAGLLFFFMLTNRYLKSTLISTIAVSAILLSPVLMFYNANFMPDSPGLAFTLMAWFFFFRYLDSDKQKDLNLFVFFGTMAALIKAVSAMCFAIVICLLIMDVIRKFTNTDGSPVFKKRMVIVLKICGGIMVVIAWYAYARWLSGHHKNVSFAMQPIMVDSMDAAKTVFERVKYWTYQYYAYETYVLLLAAAVFVIVAAKKVNKLFLSIIVLYILAGACYIYLFLYQFTYHDYYFIALMPLGFFLVLAFVDALKRISGNLTGLVMIGLSVILIFNIKECLENCKENYEYRYNSRVYLAGDYRPYWDLEPKLRAAGVTRQDKIVSAFDNSYTNSLYFMNQPGYTVEDTYQQDTISTALNAPYVKYLVVNDSAKFNKVYHKDLRDKIIIIHRGLIVYKLK